MVFCFFFFKQKTAYEIMPSLVGSEMCIRDSCTEVTALPGAPAQWAAIFARFGAKLENVSVGCCGMAGTYGHEAKNHENSLGIYESVSYTHLTLPTIYSV